MKLVHIGFPRTATTTMQLFVFPMVAEWAGLEYIRTEDLRIRRHAARLRLEKEIREPADLPKSFVVSAEDLHGVDPYFWESYADKNRTFFGSDCHVLLTVREPENYLTSLYLQACMHEGNIQRAEAYFLDDRIYSPYLSSAKFAIERFSYERIINLYRERFEKLTVAKFESMSDMQFINEIFGVPHDELWRFRDSFCGNKVNQSYSQRAVKVSIAMQAWLNEVDLSFNASSRFGALYDLEVLRLEGNIHVSSSSEGTLHKLGRKTVNRFRWGYLMRLMDRCFPADRFCLDFSALPQIKLQQLVAEYEQLPQLITYRKGA